MRMSAPCFRSVRGTLRGVEWAVVASGRRLLVAVAIAVVVGLLAISPPGAAFAERWDLAHYTQHAAIFIPAAVVAFAVRDGMRSKPIHPYVALGMGAVALVLDLASLLPPFDTAIDENEALHTAQHGLIVVAGVLVGWAIRDVIAFGRGPVRTTPAAPAER